MLVIFSNKKFVLFFFLATITINRNLLRLSLYIIRNNVHKVMYYLYDKTLEKSKAIICFPIVNVLLMLTWPLFPSLW